MCKPSNSKALGLGLAWACISLCAPVQGATVAEVIARMKQQREQESLGASPSGAVPKASKKVGMGKLPTAPLLWSIIGANDDMQAVLVYQGKAYVAQAHMPRTQMGPWWIATDTEPLMLGTTPSDPQGGPLPASAARIALPPDPNLGLVPKRP